MPSNPDDLSVSDQFLEAARRGDARAWERLVKDYRPYLFAVVMRSPGDRSPEDCSSVVQYGLGKAFERIKQFRGTTRAELLGWLAQIVSNKARDKTKGRRHASLPTGADGEDILPASDFTPSSNLTRRERAARIVEALAQLPQDYQDVIYFRVFDDLRYEEIARRMNRTNDAVRCLWVRALRRLREELGEDP